MTRYKLFVLLFVLPIIFTSCSEKPEPEISTFINSSHLDHLYEEVVIDSDTLGTIWIYCDAPDYQVVTDDDEGFTCVDDVARAIVFYCREINNSANPEDIRKVEHLMTFLFHMQSWSHYFYNFMFPNEEINTLHQNSVAGKNFWSWRACWAMTEVCMTTAPELQALRDQCNVKLSVLTDKISTFVDEYSGYELHEGISVPALTSYFGGDQTALMLIVLSNYYKITDDDALLVPIEKIATAIMETRITDSVHVQYAFLSWKNTWHAWGNSQSYALLCAAEATNKQEFVEAAKREISNFFPLIIDDEYRGFSCRKEDTTTLIEDIYTFPQIAYAIRPVVFAAVKAWRITGEDHFADIAAEAGSWLLGNNSSNKVMYDTITGRCFDGIDAAGAVNFNSGAESTIEALLTIQCLESEDKTFTKLQQIIQ